MFSQEELWLLKDKYQGQETTGFLTDCQRLEDGEPLAYIIGYVNFLNCKIWLDSRPLIPRTETEFWTEQLIKEIQNTKPTSQLHLLDLCAGSGCIGIAIAKNVANSKVDFAEVDSRHIQTIEKNCYENNLTKNQAQTIVSDLFASVTNRYNLIISNPPYIDKTLNRTEPSVKNFEPSLALYGGTDGLDIIQKIILDAPAYLEAKGQLWLEHEPEQTKAISVLSSEFFTTTTYTDQYQVNRFSKLVLK